MDVMSAGKEDKRKLIIIFEQPHLPSVQEQIMKKAQSYNKNEFVVKLQNPNVFGFDSVERNASTVIIPETIGKEKSEEIQGIYKKETKASVESFVPGNVKSEFPDETWTKKELIEFAEKADPPIDLTGARKNSDILEAINNTLADSE